jgi:hypothetical protein
VVELLEFSGMFSKSFIIKKKDHSLLNVAFIIKKKRGILERIPKKNSIPQKIRILNKEKLKTIIDLSSQYWEIEDNECRKQYWDLILIPGCSKLICSKNVNNISLLVRIARYLYFIDHQNVIK